MYGPDLIKIFNNTIPENVKKTGIFNFRVYIFYYLSTENWLFRGRLQTSVLDHRYEQACVKCFDRIFKIAGKDSLATNEPRDQHVMIILLLLRAAHEMR